MLKDGKLPTIILVHERLRPQVLNGFKMSFHTTCPISCNLQDVYELHPHAFTGSLSNGNGH